MENNNKNNAMGRKPQFENESFRVWNTTKKEKEELSKDNENEFEVGYKDLKIRLCGFNLAKNKKTNKIIIAYKFKHEDKSFLYYISKDNSKEDNKKVKEFFKFLESMNMVLNYQLIDMEEKLKEIYNEKHILDKLGDKTK